ncbi:MAG: choice-of-anchor Q domain-containing protein, partial [Prosthecobacter sp.]
GTPFAEGGAFGGRGGAYNSNGFAAGGGGAGLGGGIFNYQGTVTLENVTLVTNSAIGGTGVRFNGIGSGSSAGGAVFNYDGTVTMKHVTASGNIVQTDINNPGPATGGALYNYDAAGGATPSVTLFNTILANSTYNNATGQEVVNSGGTVTASGAASTNLIETSSGTIIGTVLTVDPALGLMTRSSGILGLFPTTGSPVLNTGDNANSLATDALGTARPLGGTVDIGAVEGSVPTAFTLTSGTLLISEATLRAVFAVNPTTGARTLLSKSGEVGAGVGFLNPLGIAVSVTQDIYVVDSDLDAVIKVDATNGNRTLISIGADDATTNAVNGNAAVGTGPSFQKTTCIAIRTDGKLLVTDPSGFSTNAVILVDPANGNRSIFSSSSVPNNVQPMFEPAGIVVHSTLGIVVADNNTSDAILKLNGATGARTVLSSATVPNGTNPFKNSNGLAEDTDGSLLLVDDTSPNRQLLRINQTTGARTVVSNLPTNIGFHGVAAGTSGIFVTSTQKPGSVYQVNPTTGVATVLSNKNVGDGVLLNNELNIGLAMVPVSLPPTITSVSTPVGNAGTALTITGTNFIPGATVVTIGGVAVTSVTVVNGTTISVVVPAGTVGSADIVVTTAGGTATGTGLFSYVDYTVNTVASGGGLQMTLTNVSNTSDTLDVSGAGSNVTFAAAGRAFSLNGAAVVTGGLTTAIPTTANGNSRITLNTQGGDDVINLSTIAGTLPHIAIDGGLGTDTVNATGTLALSSANSFGASVAAETVNFGPTSSWSVPTGDLALSADTVEIDPTATISLSGTLGVSGQTALRELVLGAEVVGSLSLTDAELDRVIAQGLSFSGDIVRVKGDISRASATILSLSPSELIFDGGALNSSGGAISLAEATIRCPFPASAISGGSSLTFAAGSSIPTLSLAISAATYPQYERLDTQVAPTLSAAQIAFTGSYVPV